MKFVNESCIGEIKQGLILNIPNTITPNDDGKNDRWEIPNLNVLGTGNSSVQIFDRNQEVVFHQETNDKIIWDETYLGRVVPTATYWYILKLADGRLFTGWLLLKNRN